MRGWWLASLVRVSVRLLRRTDSIELAVRVSGSWGSAENTCHSELKHSKFAILRRNTSKVEKICFRRYKVLSQDGVDRRGHTIHYFCRSWTFKLIFAKSTSNPT